MRRWFVVGFAVAAFVSSGCLDTRDFYGVDDPVANGLFDAGYLTWNAGKGGIAWTSDAGTMDPGGPLAAERVATGTVGWNLRTNTQGSQGTDLIARDEFVGSPYPEERWLNASRPIQLDINITVPPLPNPGTADPRGTVCSQYGFDVEVWLDTATFVGGWVHRDYGYISTNPPITSGYCPFGLRIQPEIDHIPKGGVLTIRIVHVYEATPFQYGLLGTHRSNLRIPYYSPFEVDNRVQPEATGPASAPAPSAAPTLVLLGLPGAALGRRRFVAAAAAALLLASGCIGSPSKARDAATGPASPGATFVIDPGTVPVDSPPGYGVVAGLVNDTLGEVRPGVHLAILKSDNATFTTETGRYRLTVKAGDRVLIANAEGYHAVKIPVHVFEHRLLYVNITIKPLVDPTEGERRHRHDNWGPATKLPIGVENDGEVTMGFSTASGANLLNPAGEATGARACLWAQPVAVFSQTGNACVQEFFLATEEIVLPGTADLEFKVSWDPAKNRVERAGIGFIAGNGTNLNVWMYPRARDVPTHVRTNWDVTDVGHQRFTFWTFYLYVPINPGSDTVPAQTSLTQVLDEPFHVTITATKGPVPKEPSHPKFWEKGDTVTVINAEPYSFPLISLNCYASYPYNDPSPYSTTGWVQNLLTPPGTGHLGVTLEQPTPWPPANIDWGLVMKPANLRANAPASEFTPISPKKVEGTTKSYEIPLKAEETDQFYQSTSNWRWLIDDGRDGGSFTCTTEAKTLKLTVKAIRDPDL